VSKNLPRHWQTHRLDLNPHQIEAALFAFRSPLSNGAILADEVGLGKTIEAGLVLSQKWAERKRKILIITPANLRKQWNLELLDKFFLPSLILEAKNFKQIIASGNFNPFVSDAIVLCSYQFARSKESYIAGVTWDLVVVDEAHRLRNVYKPQNKIAKAIKNAISSAPKILLTATPLQNSLLELYGLVSIVDDFVLGDLKSFRHQFGKLTGDDDLTDLRDRLKSVCIRTLRRQILEYIKYTNRIAIVEEFVPSQDEQHLYDLVSQYLQRDQLFALPKSQRKLMTLILTNYLTKNSVDDCFLSKQRLQIYPVVRLTSLQYCSKNRSNVERLKLFQHRRLGIQPSLNKRWISSIFGQQT